MAKLIALVIVVVVVLAVLNFAGVSPEQFVQFVTGFFG